MTNKRLPTPVTTPVARTSPTPVARASPNSLPISPKPTPSWNYENILDKDKHLYTEIQSPPSSPKKYPTNNNPSPPSPSNNKNNNNNPASGGKQRKSVGGVNLTPLISALLLAGIKLALDKKKKANATKSAKSAKSAASKSTKSAKATKPLKRQRKTI